MKKDITQNEMITDIPDRLAKLHKQLPVTTRLVAVSKFHPAEMIEEAYRAGQRIFGESHVQEIQQKRALLPDDIQWHFIGHLQTNKVKYIAPYIDLIHSVDSPRLLNEISRQALRFHRRVRCLLQIHIAREETKFGFMPEECIDYLRNGEWRYLEGVELCGLMCMASNVDDEEQIDREFATAQRLFNSIREEFFFDNPSFCERSWGMSHDYPIAIRHQATLIRVGSLIFGERHY